MSSQLRNVVLAAVVLSTACTRDFEEPFAYLCPNVPVDDFRNVSSVLEKRCGSLDCHGDLARPLRIMGSNGLRLFTPEEFSDPSQSEEAGGTPGGQKATTEQELEQNRQSLCGVEPERTMEVVIGNLAPEELMVIRKPSERERHKGAQIFLKGSAAESCLVSWLQGEVILGDCIEALQAP